MVLFVVRVSMFVGLCLLFVVVVVVCCLLSFVVTRCCSLFDVVS